MDFVFADFYVHVFIIADFLVLPIFLFVCICRILLVYVVH